MNNSMSLQVIYHDKMQIKKWASILCTVLFLYSSTIYAQADKTVDLTVIVDGLRDSKGVLQFSLYNKNGSIPDEHFTQYLQQHIEPITNASATTIFKNLPAAEYAVNILHDENSNGEIDKGFVLPVEGIGFSRYSTVNLFNRPNFNDASIKLDVDTKINIKIIYF